MERTGVISGSARTRGCGSLRRFLTHIGAQLIGISEEQETGATVSWWDDTLSLGRVGEGAARAATGALGSRQVEFWVDEDLKHQAPAVAREARAEYVAEPSSVARKVPERVKPKLAPKTPDASARAEKEPRRFDIARFLSVNGGVYDGRDHRRWMALPGRGNGLRFQFMKDRDADPNSDFKVARSLPRNFGGTGLH